jgi:hypothetical protein
VEVVGNKNHRSAGACLPMPLMLASALALVVALLIAGCGTSATNSKADRAATTTAAPVPRAEFAGLVDIGDGRKMF